MTNQIKEQQEQADLNIYALLCGKPKAERIEKEIRELLEQ